MTNNYYLLITYIVRIFFIVDVFINLIRKNYYFLSICIAGILLTFWPILYKKIFKRNVSLSINISTIIFIFLSLYLGTMHGFYNLFWWDFMLHFISGIMLSFLGIDILKVLIKKEQLLKMFYPLFLPTYTVSFSTLCGVIWEIYEFSMDNLFRLNMQLTKTTGVTDTMSDLIADLLGGICISLYIYFKNKRLRL